MVYIEKKKNEKKNDYSFYFSVIIKILAQNYNHLNITTVGHKKSCDIIKIQH